MSMRRPAGFISANYDPLKNPDAPTIGTASFASATTVSVTFTAPTNVGGSAITAYYAVATDSSSGAQFTATGASSPITITGLTTGNTYTVRVWALNSYGPSAYSAASNSVTPVAQGQQAYTTAGTYTWVAPAGVTSVSVVAIGGGGGIAPSTLGGGGGGLGYKNNYAVTPGNSYTVVVGVAGTNGVNSPGGDGGDSYFVSTAIVRGGGGRSYDGGITAVNGTYTGDGGGNGGGTSAYSYGGNGAGGYSGNGGNGGTNTTIQPTAGSGGGGGGGGYGVASGWVGVAGGGGVGILGQGANGAAGVSSGSAGGTGGGGGSGGTNGTNHTYLGNPNGGVYGAGAGWAGKSGVPTLGTSSGGAVRIIWPGTTRSFPSTNTGNL